MQSEKKLVSMNQKQKPEANTIVGLENAIDGHCPLDTRIQIKKLFPGIRTVWGWNA